MHYTVYTAVEFILCLEALQFSYKILHFMVSQRIQSYCVTVTCIHDFINIKSMLSVLECPLDVHYGLLWKPAVRNSTVNVPCSEIHASFRKRLYITRKCSINGIWMAANLSSCTVRPDFTSLLILSFLCSTSSEDVNIEMKV